ncbi:MAG TPA: DNA recombination protein RmuC [Jatrophihabitans sp.]|jgi:DNA recombination protein RmuC|uniref:DNA recombination protein RmuC n=1 Tax=Jatrophihabitans sp. TaxID=1932789 RepID=UPI002F1A52BB
MTALAFLLLGLLLGSVLGAAAGFWYGRARRALSELSEARLDAARSAAAGDLAERQHSIEALVSPIRDALHQVQAQLHSAERDRLSATSALDEHLSAMRLSADGLRTETAQLVTALRAPQVRGRWGELQLERAVEIAGLVEHVDYVVQPTSPGTADNDGALRPDLVINLIDGKHIVVDSKVAFAGYLEAMEARDEFTRAARLKAHARQLRRHVDDLGAKAYWSRFSPSPEFVVCFVPADAFLDAALREDPALLEHAFARNVILATPTTLVALLRTVGHTWRQQSLARNTAEVSQLGRELYQRLAGMGSHLDKLGRSLNAAVGSFNNTVGALEGRVLVSARRLAELSVIDPASDGELAETEQILAVTRTLTAEELMSRVP